ncbi:MAG: pyridoxal-phosphate dependent enzyme, partial [Candidatus Omnitrophica bacterium]|nr:pyridoxal-phosphate dependent enzyme [Candidatus Omnitrophota bacterium]
MDRRLRTSVSVEQPAQRAATSELLRRIGRTPLVPLPRLEREFAGVRLFAKAEWHNPGGSVKDRAAASIIAEAEADGR